MKHMLMILPIILKIKTKIFLSSLDFIIEAVPISFREGIGKADFVAFKNFYDYYVEKT